MNLCASNTHHSACSGRPCIQVQEILELCCDWLIMEKRKTYDFVMGVKCGVFECSVMLLGPRDVVMNTWDVGSGTLFELLTLRAAGIRKLADSLPIIPIPGG